MHLRAFFSLTFLFPVLLCNAQRSPYTVDQYYAGKLIVEEVFEHFSEPEVDPDILKLALDYRGGSGLIYLYRARAEEDEQRTLALIDSACFYGFGHIGFKDDDPFYQQYQEQLTNCHRKHHEAEALKAVKELVKIDQEIREEVSTGSPQDLKNRQELDRLIKQYGWPGTGLTGNRRGIGPAIVLAHQGNLTPSDFTHYYELAVERSMARMESWEVPLFILEQRMQWLGSDLRAVREFPDTLNLEFDEKGAIEKQLSLPYLTAMGKTLCTNRSKGVRLSVRDEQTAKEVKHWLYGFDHMREFPPEIIAYLEAGGFDSPAPLSEERVLISIDENLEPGQLVYKFFRPGQ